MNAPIKDHARETVSVEFQSLVKQVETALVQAAADARELAERTRTPLITRKTEKNIADEGESG